jgi:hypothetical protein
VGNDVYLPQQVHHVEFVPVLGYLAICHGHYIHAITSIRLPSGEQAVYSRLRFTKEAGHERP